MITCQREVWPLPDKPGRYGDIQDFEAARKESGQWVFWNDRVELILEGRYHEVKPLHVELSPTYLCNFSCPWCSCRAAREDWCGDDVFSHPKATTMTVMGAAKLDRILDNLAQYRVGIQWVGGEPTMNALLFEAAIKAHERGLQQCLFTNGSLIDERRVERLLDAELIFIRFSLDAATKSVHRVHHGYSDRRPYADMVLNNLRSAVARKTARKARTMIGVSIVVDERNIGDIVATAEHLYELCVVYGPGAIDYCIIRPAYKFYSAEVLIERSTIDRLLSTVHDERFRQYFVDAGIKLIAPSDSFVEAADEAVDYGDGIARGCGWFGEVNPNGDLVVCSDRYGNPDDFIGNLAQQSLDEIWVSEKRSDVLQQVEARSCFKQMCPRNGRGYHLNRIFATIEQYRQCGRLDDVRRWIEDLRTVLPKPEHSFFL